MNKICCKILKLPPRSIQITNKYLLSTQSETPDDTKELESNQNANDTQNKVDGFRVFEIFKKSSRDVKKYRTSEKVTYIERYKQMSVDQDWTDVWPTSSMFRQSVVPLPVHQGHVKNLAENSGITPGKYGNVELMKIPNFLHLTPPHIKKHCAAIKKFCTPWPAELKTDEDCSKYFPIEIETTDYIYAGPSIRDERSRIATLKISIDNLKLDEHAKDKLIKLAEHRYNPKTGILTITSDRCPYRQQNIDYVKYLLTALYFESWKIEPWESEITEEDMRNFKWTKSKSKEIISDLVTKIDSKVDQNVVDHYANSLTNLFNNGETNENLVSYKEKVLELLGIESNDNKSNNTSPDSQRNQNVL